VKFAAHRPFGNSEVAARKLLAFAKPAFAGIWTEFKGDRRTKSKPIPGPHLIAVALGARSPFYHQSALRSWAHVRSAPISNLLVLRGS
jgi:hypothetical protein